MNHVFDRQHGDVTPQGSSQETGRILLARPAFPKDSLIGEKNILSAQSGKFGGSLFMQVGGPTGGGVKLHGLIIDVRGEPTSERVVQISSGNNP